MLEGEAHFLVQRYHYQELVDVSLFQARQGDLALIPPNSGHVMINTSSNRLVVGELVSRGCRQECAPFVERKGGAYFVLEGGKLVKNAHYPSLPDVQIMKSSDFGLAEYSSLLESFVKTPELFGFLSDIQKFKSTRAPLRWTGQFKALSTNQV